VNGHDDPLRESLSDIADQVGPVDLYERSLRRSRRIGRRRTAVTSLAVVLLVGLGGAAVLRSGLVPDTAQPAPADMPWTAEPERSVTGLPGSLFYVDPENTRLISPTPDGGTTIVATAVTGAVDVSPDGTRLAEAADGVLRTRALPGGAPVTVPGGITPDDIPAWSPDGTRLLLTRTVNGKVEAGAVDMATGRFTALAAAVDGSRLRWSGDGTSIVYRTPGCRLVVARADGTEPVTVPAIGDDDRVANPNGYTACELVSVSRDASRIAVGLGVGVSADSGPDPGADTTVNAATGAIAVPPVEGSIDAVLFRPDGTMLVRSSSDDRATLTLLAADDTVIAQVAEPATVKAMNLVGYTR
jgi:TolB protein